MTLWTTVAEDGFEGAWYDFDDEGELTCPLGWAPDWEQGSGEPGILVRPEYDKEDVRVRSGKSAAKIFSTHASHRAVLYRSFLIKYGESVRVTGYGAMFGFKCGMGLRIGIDPFGGTDFESGEVVWSNWVSQYDKDWIPEKFYEMVVGDVAQSTYVTVFLFSKSDYKGTPAASYWDDVWVEVLSDDAGPPPTDGDPVLDTLQDILEEVQTIRQLLKGGGCCGS